MQAMGDAKELVPRTMPNSYNVRHSWNLKIDEHVISSRIRV